MTLSLPTIPIMSAQELSSLQEEARQIIQEMEKQELRLFIKTERAARKKSWDRVGGLLLLTGYMLVCEALCGYR
jgi:CHASE3 domain sensor protein